MSVTTIPIKLLSIEDDGFHLQIKIYVNGKPANVLVDTGASKTVFDKERMKIFVKNKKFDLHEKRSTGLGTSNMESHFTIISHIKIGKIEIHDYNAVLLDLHHVNESYHSIGLKQIDGVIGSDLLHKFKAIIDYNKKQLKLTPRKRKLKTAS